LLELLRPRLAPPRRTTTRAWTAAAPPLPRQDIGKAVATARAALPWERSSADGRAQVLYRLAEQLVAQHSRLVGLLAERDGKAGAEAELQASVDSLNDAAARAGRGDGAVGQPPRALTLTLRQPLGVIGIVAPDTPPLLGLLRLLAAALAPGNRVVLVPSAAQPLLAAELGALFDRAGLPAGALVLAGGRPDEQADTLAAHPDVDALWWPAATAAQAARADALAAGNLKRTRFGQGLPGAEDRLLFEHSTRSKILWLPAGT
jgi:aldehyde dehydrogenase (NAD+)